MEVREWLLPTKLRRRTAYHLPLVRRPVRQTKLQCFGGGINKQILGMHSEIEQATKGICDHKDSTVHWIYFLQQSLDSSYH